MAVTSQSCNPVREYSPITFVTLTRFCLLTKTVFICFLLIFPKYYTQVFIQMLFMVPSLMCEHLTMNGTAFCEHQLKSKLA